MASRVWFYLAEKNAGVPTTTRRSTILSNDPPPIVDDLIKAIKVEARQGAYDPISAAISATTGLTVEEVLDDKGTTTLLPDPAAPIDPVKFYVVRYDAAPAHPEYFAAVGAKSLAGGGWKYEAWVRQAARYTKFRSRVYACAVHRGAYDESINYSESPITSNADLLVVVFFTHATQAQNFRSDLIRLIQSYGGSDDLIETIVHVPEHVCTKLSKCSNIDKENTPDRASWGEEVVDDPLSVSSSVFHRELATEDIQRECLCDFSWFSERNEKALWAHIKARKRCRSDAEKKGSANRLVMNWALYTIFDDDFMNDGRTPVLTVFCEDRLSEATTGGYVRLMLRVVFRFPATAQTYSQFLRQPVTQLSETEFTVFVEKKASDESKFREVLTQRHDGVVKLW